MKDEIKEILKKIKSVSDFDDYVDFVGTEFKPLLDYITNLQIERNDYKDRFNLMVKFRDKALARELMYKSRIDKATEYIKEHQRKDKFLNLNEWQTRYLLNILEGSDKE